MIVGEDWHVTLSCIPVAECDVMLCNLVSFLCGVCVCVCACVCMLCVCVCVCVRVCVQEGRTRSRALSFCIQTTEK